MKRLALLIVILPLFASAPTWEIGNAFRDRYGEWGALRNVRVDSPITVNTVSAPEFLAWQKVKSSWHQLEKSVESEYRGEK